MDYSALNFIHIYSIKLKIHIDFQYVRLKSILLNWIKVDQIKLKIFIGFYSNKVDWITLE